jgi:hypothetical protein
MMVPVLLGVVDVVDADAHVANDGIGYGDRQGDAEDGVREG